MTPERTTRDTPAPYPHTHTDNARTIHDARKRTNAPQTERKTAPSQPHPTATTRTDHKNTRGNEGKPSKVLSPKQSRRKHPHAPLHFVKPYTITTHADKLLQPLLIAKQPRARRQSALVIRYLFID